MATNTGKRFDLFRTYTRIDRVGEIGMAVATVCFHHATVVIVDHDGVVKILRRESQRVKEPVSPFAVPFANKVMRRVAIVAFGDVMMSRFDPRIEVILHDVAVRTRFTF